MQILAFDIFGTVVDWHGSICREMRTAYPQVDADAFALAWRDGYQPAMERVRSGERGWTLIDDLHRSILDQIAPAFGLAHLHRARIYRTRDSAFCRGNRNQPIPSDCPGYMTVVHRF